MHNKRLTVSVVMCTHNGMEFIEEQLESILSQTYPPFELIVSDDNSTDGTLDFVTSYVNTYIATHPELNTLKFRTISNIPALGVTKNFEGAISAATGDLIALSDQDDVWVPTKLETMVSYFDSNSNLMLCHSDALLVNQVNQSLHLSLFDSLRTSKKEISLINDGKSLSVYLRRNLVTGATTLFRRNLIELAHPFPQELLHDEWLGLVAAAGGQVLVTCDELIRYRQHSNNQVGASRLGFRHAIGRIIHPGKQRNLILLSRVRAIRNHPFFQRQVSPDIATLVQDKLNHEEVRSSYPASRRKRLRKVLRETSTHRYSTFGLGIQDIIRDFLQPND